MNFFRLISAAVVLAAILSPVEPGLTAPGKTFTVTSLADTVDANPGDGQCADAGGNCTLRAAIMESNTLAGSDSIILPADTFLLVNKGSGEDAAVTGDLDIIGNLTINGAGANKTIIDGLGLEDRLFDIQAGAVVTKTGMTIRHGKLDNPNGGGGIRNQGTLTISDSEISANRAHAGGGISNGDGVLSLIKSNVIANIAESVGGGVYNWTKGDLPPKN